MTQYEALKRARKLLAMCQSQNANEAETARKILLKIMKKYDLSHEDVTKPEPPKEQPVIYRQPPQAIVPKDQIDRTSWS